VQLLARELPDRSEALVGSRRVTPEILIVGDPAGRRPLADAIAAAGYAVGLCSPRELNRRVRSGEPPAVIIACMSDVDPDVLLAGLRRTRAGASIPVILYGRLGGSLRDLADVLDIGADHFIEEPAAEGEFEDALAQYAGPAHARSSRREEPRPRGFERERDRPERERDRPERERDRPERERDRPERDRPERGRPERGRALGELHRTLDRLEASLRSDDHRSDPELSGLGLDGIPDVDPPGEALGESLLDDSEDHSLTSAARRDRGRDEPRPRPRPSQREPTDRLGLARRPLGPDEDTDAGRRRRDDVAELPRGSRGRRDDEAEPARGSRGRRDDEAELARGSRGRRDDEASLARGRGRRDDVAELARGRRGRHDDDDDERSDHTRPWERPESEGPLRRGREFPGPARAGRPPPPTAGEGERARSSAVLRARRPDRDGPAPRRDDHGRDDHSRATGREDPHARATPWPTDFDPSESTMIRRERGDATTRRRSLGGSRGGSLGDSRDFPWGRGREVERPPSPEPQPEPQPKPRPKPAPRPSPRAIEVEPEVAPSPRRRGARRVEPRASELHIDPSLRASGKLDADIGVATILWALHTQRFTGKLRLTRQRIEKQLWLHDGEAVFARSTATSDRLVDGLLRRGVLTRPQYETARRLAAKEPRRAGELLVDAGFLKARELDVLLRDHLARVIDSTFVWTDGAWSTEPGDRTDEPIQLEVPMAALILDGVRYRCDASELEDRLTQRIGGRGPLVPRLRLPSEANAELGDDQAGARAAVLDEIGESFRLLPEEESWLRRFDGRHGVAALLADGADEQALFALLFTLDLGGYVDLREQPEPLVSSDRDPAALDGERVLERLRLAREADYFELLGAGRDASRSELRQAHADLLSTFADDVLEPETRRRHARELRELRAALDEARDILTDDAMRSAYLAHLGDG
jgi:hypothetical protein